MMLLVVVMKRRLLPVASGVRGRSVNLSVKGISSELADTAARLAGEFPASV